MKVLVVYDGSIDSRRAIAFGIEKVRAQGGGALTAYVLGNTAEPPFPSPKARPSDAAPERLGERVSATSVRSGGEPRQELPALIASGGFDHVVTPPVFADLFDKTGLPVTIIPGTLLVPLESTAPPGRLFETVLAEAASADAAILLLGIVPVHLYGPTEQDEVERLKQKTLSMLSETREALAERGAAAGEIMRTGYADEVILRVAQERMVSKIIIPVGSEATPELSIAAGLMLDAPLRLRWPMLLIPC